MATIWCCPLLFFDTPKKEAQTPTLLSPLSLSLSHDFTWDDVVRFSPPPRKSDSSHLQGFFQKVNLCNRNAEKLCEFFVPFVVEEPIVGYVHNKLSTYKDRTKAVGYVIKCLGEEFIPGIRNELYPVKSSFGTPEFFSLEQAAAPYFGIKVYRVQMNGYVERDGKKYLWLAKRSKVKPTFSGKLDEMVAGGQVNSIVLVFDAQARAVGAVSYLDIDEYRLKRDVLFCYDLKVPEDFIPSNEDEEVESFKLIPVT